MEREEEAEPVVTSKTLGTTRQLSGNLGTSSGLPPVSPTRSIPRSGKGSLILKKHTASIFNDLYLTGNLKTLQMKYCAEVEDCDYKTFIKTHMYILTRQEAKPI